MIDLVPGSLVKWVGNALGFVQRLRVAVFAVQGGGAVDQLRGPDYCPLYRSSAGQGFLGAEHQFVEDLLGRTHGLDHANALAGESGLTSPRPSRLAAAMTGPEIVP